MKLEQQVSSPDQGKRLKELGIIFTNFQWCEAGKWSEKNETDNPDQWQPVLLLEMPGLHPSSVSPIGQELTTSDGDVREFCDVREVFPAYTVAELGVMLPEEYYSYQSSFGWITYNDIGKNYTGELHQPTEAKTRALMLIWLLETDKITAEEVNQRLANS